MASDLPTEDGINPDAGTDQGYDGKYFRIDPRNFAGNANMGDDGIARLAGIFSELGKATRDISYKWGTGNSNDDNLGVLDFSSSDKPLPPDQPKVKFFERLGGVLIVWKSPPAPSFLAYRSSQGSGAYNGHSNGRYKLIGQTGKNWFFDKDTVQFSVWYLIIGTNGGKIGGHSEESEELFLKGASAAPQTLSLPAK